MTLKKQRYTTAKAWLDFPPGTECWAERRGSTLMLTFDDGREVAAYGHYAQGLEEPRQYLWDKLSEQVSKDIDREVLGDLICSAEATT